MIYFDEEDMKIDNTFKDIAIEAINKSLDFLEFEYEIDVTLIITDNETIRSINLEHRKIDRATDVLSFPMIEWPFPKDYDYLEANISLNMNPDNDCILLGDIVLSMDKVASQALEFGHSLQREFVFLIVHSMLHLFGYDHMTVEEEKEMIQIQKDILLTIDYEK
jgi:probable rRNA maturation factor